MDPVSLPALGGWAGLLVSLAYIGRLAFDWWRDRRKAPQERTSATVSDAAAANAMLLASLKEEREEVQRLSGEVAELRTQNSVLYQRMRELREQYEREIMQLRGELEEALDRLESLRLRLRTDLPES